MLLRREDLLEANIGYMRSELGNLLLALWVIWSKLIWLHLESAKVACCLGLAIVLSTILVEWIAEKLAEVRTARTYAHDRLLLASCTLIHELIGRLAKFLLIGSVILGSTRPIGCCSGIFARSMCRSSHSSICCACHRFFNRLRILDHFRQGACNYCSWRCITIISWASLDLILLSWQHLQDRGLIQDWLTRLRNCLWAFLILFFQILASLGTPEVLVTLRTYDWRSTIGKNWILQWSRRKRWFLNGVFKLFWAFRVLLRGHWNRDRWGIVYLLRFYLVWHFSLFVTFQNLNYSFSIQFI